MANTKKTAKKAPKKVSPTEKLLAEQKKTDIANAERHEEMVKEEAAKVEATKAAAENQAPVVTQPESVTSSAREEAWKKHLAEYEKLNPVKYAAKKANGEFDEIPASFVGTNQMVISG